jgi:biotin carboxylase
MHLSDSALPPTMISPSKRLLLLASKLGYQTQGFADAARLLGVQVEFATDRCHKLDDPWGDGALPLHFEDPQSAALEIVHHFEKNPPDAILALGDRPTPAAAYAARALGLAGNAPDAVLRCRNKLTQRQTFRGAGIPIPDFFAFAAEESPETILSRVKFPCVVKPLSLAASQGVVRADNPEEFRAAVARIRALLSSPEIQVTRESALDELLVERYVPGREVAIEGLLDCGHLRVLAIFDKPDPLEGPYFEETIYVTPSRLPDSQQSALRDCATAAVRALGLTHGPVHAEFRINEAGPWVLEVAPRPIGGLCSRALRFGPKHISLEELLLRHALSLGGTDIERERDASGVMMIPVARSGIFERVEGVEDAERTPGVTEILITARVKDFITAWPEGASYLGFIFARAASPAEVEAALREAHAKLQFTFSPRLPVEHPLTRRITSA